MSLYSITVLSNLNVLSFVMVLASILVIMATFISPDMSTLQRRLVFLLGVVMAVLSLLWIVFAPNGALLREWAIEYGYNSIEIPCLICKD